ncbi:MAG: TadE/TadG family type IV pilus assembly protein, partial [Pseudomonadota bacterium]
MSQQQYRLRQLTFQTPSVATTGGFSSLSTAPHDVPLNEPAPHPLAGHWAKRWGTRFRQDDSGSTTVEFALCIIPFVMVTIGIIEVMLMFFTIATIEGAMDQATRMVRTGELQTAA